jgi:hypothetical protein
LPVTKSVVVESGLGKAVGALEKNKICVGSPNEVAIRERVQRVKDAWNASVKANKETSAAKKRALDAAAAESPSKKAKTEAPSKKSSSFSSLLNKVSTSGSSKSSAKDTASKKDNSMLQNGSTGNGVAAQKVAEKKKGKKQTLSMCQNVLCCSRLTFLVIFSLCRSPKESRQESEMGRSFWRSALVVASSQSRGVRDLCPS